LAAVERLWRAALGGNLPYSFFLGTRLAEIVVRRRVGIDRLFGVGRRPDDLLRVAMYMRRAVIGDRFVLVVLEPRHHVQVAALLDCTVRTAASLTSLTLAS